MHERVARAWDECAWALGIRARRDVRDDLIRRWSEPHRRYHDLSHLDACLVLFDEHRDLAERPGEVAAALLFHDAIYDPKRDDNEARSAALAREQLADAPAASVERITAAIEATRTHEAGSSADFALVIDVDLSILAADPVTYDVFEDAIRAEYAHVPDDLFRAGRAAILARFDARDPLYRALGALEPSAHANLRRTIARLQR